jgi:hypothetical protein
MPEAPKIIGSPPTFATKGHRQILAQLGQAGIRR